MGTTRLGAGNNSRPRRTAAPDSQPHMAHERVNRGLLAEPERRALRWLAERTPAWVEPDDMTAVGVAGAVLVMVGFICANISAFFYILVLLGLLLNWYGDSLDGTLARYRGIERPQAGYFIDHSCDLISQTFIFVGFGFSPYFTLFSALLALSMYLLMSSYTYLKVLILRTHQLAYGGMGATELRVAIGCWGLLAIWIGPDLTGAELMHHAVLDEVTGSLWILVFAGFILMVRSDLSKFLACFDEHEEIRISASATCAMCCQTGQNLVRPPETHSRNAAPLGNLAGLDPIQEWNA